MFVTSITIIIITIWIPFYQIMDYRYTRAYILDPCIQVFYYWRRFMKKLQQNHKNINSFAKCSYLDWLRSFGFVSKSTCKINVNSIQRLSKSLLNFFFFFFFTICWEVKIRNWIFWKSFFNCLFQVHYSDAIGNWHNRNWTPSSCTLLWARWSYFESSAAGNVFALHIPYDSNYCSYS